MGEQLSALPGKFSWGLRESRAVQGLKIQKNQTISVHILLQKHHTRLTLSTHTLTMFFTPQGFAGVSLVGQHTQLLLQRTNSLN